MRHVGKFHHAERSNLKHSRPFFLTSKFEEPLIFMQKSVRPKNRPPLFLVTKFFLRLCSLGSNLCDWLHNMPKVKHYIHRNCQNKLYLGLSFIMVSGEENFNGLIFIDKFCFIIWTIKNMHSRFLSYIFSFFENLLPWILSRYVIPLLNI